MDFRQMLAERRVIVFDGAMGTQIEKRGAPAGGPSCVVAPDVVRDVHLAYIGAGADVITTNTFCMNSIYMPVHCPALDLAEVNRAGVRIAREAVAGRAVAIAGDIGPAGIMLAPMGPGSEEQFYAAFAEQVRVLDGEGVDLFIIETMMDVNEAVIAVRACVENSTLPVVASMTYSTSRSGGRTMMGNRAADCAVALAQAGAAVVAMNCGEISPADAVAIVVSYTSVSTAPVLIQANAGLPLIVDGEAVYAMSPEEFSAGMVLCHEAGAQLVGGCCGTTPDHIAALASAVK